MSKKLGIASFIANIVMVIALVFLTVADQNEGKDTTDVQRIEQYSSIYFRFVETLEVEVDDESSAMFVSMSFVPEVGSFIIKNELYKEVAYHALKISEFYPETEKFEYIILSDAEKTEALFLTINEEYINVLSSNYYGQTISENGGQQTDYSVCFSEIIETDLSKSWK